MHGCAFHSTFIPSQLQLQIKTVSKVKKVVLNWPARRVHRMFFLGLTETTVSKVIAHGTVISVWQCHWSVQVAAGFPPNMVGQTPNYATWCVQASPHTLTSIFARLAWEMRGKERKYAIRSTRIFLQNHQTGPLLAISTSRILFHHFGRSLGQCMNSSERSQLWDWMRLNDLRLKILLRLFPQSDDHKRGDSRWHSTVKQVFSARLWRLLRKQASQVQPAHRLVLDRSEPPVHLAWPRWIRAKNQGKHDITLLPVSSSVSCSKARMQMCFHLLHFIAEKWFKQEGIYGQWTRNSMKMTRLAKKTSIETLLECIRTAKRVLSFALNPSMHTLARMPAPSSLPPADFGKECWASKHVHIFLCFLISRRNSTSVYYDNRSCLQRSSWQVQLDFEKRQQLAYYHHRMLAELVFLNASCTAFVWARANDHWHLWHNSAWRWGAVMSRECQTCILHCSTSMVNNFTNDMTNIKEQRTSLRHLKWVSHPIWHRSNNQLSEHIHMPYGEWHSLATKCHKYESLSTTKAAQVACLATLLQSACQALNYFLRTLHVAHAQPCHRFKISILRRIWMAIAEARARKQNSRP